MMRFLWWILSLAIAGVIIYSLMSARGNVRNGANGRDDGLVRTGEGDDDFKEEFAEDVPPRLDEGVYPGTPFLNLDTVAAATSRGAGGIGDEDEEYGASLPFGVNYDGEDGEDSDDDDEITPEEDNGFIIEGRDRLEKQTYMNADDVVTETTKTAKKGKDDGEFIKKW